MALKPFSLITPHQCRGTFNLWSISLSPFYYPDVLGVGIFLPRLIVNIHPASTHALDCDSLAIHVHGVGVNRRDGHFGGSVSSPPFNQ